jgi:hypothetical protein
VDRPDDVARDRPEHRSAFPRGTTSSPAGAARVSLKYKATASRTRSRTSAGVRLTSIRPPGMAPSQLIRSRSYMDTSWPPNVPGSAADRAALAESLAGPRGAAGQLYPLARLPRLRNFQVAPIRPPQPSGARKTTGASSASRPPPRLVEEASLSCTLRTPPLPATHAAVGNPW